MYNRKWGHRAKCKLFAPNLVYRQCERLGAFNPPPDGYTYRYNQC